jgi:glycerol-3-phosphate dehydrogenase
MTVKLEDVLARRLRALFLDGEAAIAAAPAVAALMARLQGRAEGWVAAQLADFTALARHYRANPAP